MGQDAYNDMITDALMTACARMGANTAGASMQQ
jgi:hypothetical protein